MTLATGGTVGYDYLIYAVGSVSADPQVPERPNSHPIADFGGGAAAAFGPRRRPAHGPGDGGRVAVRPASRPLPSWPNWAAP